MKILFAYFDFTVNDNNTFSSHLHDEYALNFSTEYNFSVVKKAIKGNSGETRQYIISQEKKPEDEPKKDEQKDKSKKETEIASFTTKIYTKDSGRQNNLTLACSALNNTTIENGKTFSFSKTVGRATSSKGYKKADVFRNGNVVEALGGGLCQVSTTLYNAVLKIPELKVTERHPHSNKVPYIKSGKDAAVSYGAQDFKFVNNTGNTIKIKASNTKNNVTVKLFKLE